jgi:hypothetical protein
MRLTAHNHILRFGVSGRLAESFCISGTAWYQLNHSTIRVGIRRFHVVTWFGGCGYSKFKSAEVVSEASCPACEGEMDRCFHAGKRRIVKDVGDVDYVAVFVDDEFDEFGEPNYVEVVGSRRFG